jgi:hypothetical protein
MLGSIGEVYPRASKPTPPEHDVVVVYDLSEPDAWDATLLPRKAWDRRYSRVSRSWISTTSPSSFCPARHGSFCREGHAPADARSTPAGEHP